MIREFQLMLADPGAAAVLACVSVTAWASGVCFHWAVTKFLKDDHAQDS